MWPNIFRHVVYVHFLLSRYIGNKDNLYVRFRNDMQVIGTSLVKRYFFRVYYINEVTPWFYGYKRTQTLQLAYSVLRFS